MGLLEETLAAIRPLDDAAMARARDRQRRLTKPEGSLGRLEEIAIRLAGMTGAIAPDLSRRAIVVMAADHGVCAEGVSAYPSSVTAQMVANFVRGGAAINVLARAAGADVVVADLGVAGEIPREGVLHRSLGPGTANMAAAPAMSRAAAVAAVEAGIAIARDLAGAGTALLGTGDMGIGNTTSSSAIVAAVTGASAASVTGRGTGVDDATLARKVGVIERALARHRPDPRDPLGVLAAVGGFEIGGLAGLILGAASTRTPVVVDGFISGAAALLAAELSPLARDYMFAAHRSVEQGHRLVLERLELVPLLNLEMRLGEGTGCALAMPIVDAAVRLMREMATFDEAGVSERSERARIS